MFAVQVLESVVKNCGQTVHDEVASKQTMEELKDLLKVAVSLPDPVPLLLLVQPFGCFALKIVLKKNKITCIL